MTFSVIQAKNGEKTLTVNGVFIYSNYHPKKDAERFIIKEIDPLAEGYILLGLGLGYHIEALCKLTSKQIFLLTINDYELELLERYGVVDILKDPRIHIVNKSNIQLLNLNYQVIVPYSWMKAMGNNHELFPLLEDIKIRQMSHKTFGEQLEKNFIRNMKLGDSSIGSLKSSNEGHIGCLVSSGPSLDETIDTLFKMKKNMYILCVGSALKSLLKKNIIPDAVIVTDPLDNVIEQLNKTFYSGTLFYLATANHTAVCNHTGKRIIIFQEGYELSEKEAIAKRVPLIETGGSVATTGLSLLEYLGFDTIVLFGQDFGFKGENTHSKSSTSGKTVADNMDFRKVRSNSGYYIHTTSNLSTYRRWFERKAQRSKIKILNTAKDGAEIEGIPYVDIKDLDCLFP